jgi:quercetin dioxygenase-like cupin family protein
MMLAGTQGAAAMVHTTFEQFSAQQRERGFDEILERVWPPGTVLDTHTHPFAVSALVVRGELWLSCGDSTRHLQAGDSFELDKGAPHAERYGAEGAMFWAARRHA